MHAYNIGLKICTSSLPIPNCCITMKCTASVSNTLVQYEKASIEDRQADVPWKSIKRTWAEPFEMNVKIEQELNFVVDDSRLFLDAQEAKKVSERYST